MFTWTFWRPAICCSIRPGTWILVHGDCATLLLKKTPFQRTTVTQEAFSHYLHLLSCPVLPRFSTAVYNEESSSQIAEAVVSQRRPSSLHSVCFISLVKASETQYLEPGLLVVSTVWRRATSLWEQHWTMPPSHMVEVHELTRILRRSLGPALFLLQICSSLLNDKADTPTHWDQNQGTVNS
jgi:hypothetical protein